MVASEKDTSDMGEVGLGLSGGLALTTPQALRLLGAAHEAGLSPLMITEVSGLSATEVAAAFGATTPGARIGTGIVPIASRTVPAIAMAARTVAQLCSTPFLLGVGVSSPQIVEGWHGADHDPGLATTRARLTELRAALDGERRGSFGMPADASGSVKVLLGALGPRMVRLGDEVADGVILNHTPAAEVPTDLHVDAILLAYVWVLACEDGERRGRRDLVSYMMAEPYADHFTRLGYGDAVQAVRELAADGLLRDAPDSLPQALVDAMFVRPADLSARLADYAAVGATPILMPVTGEAPITETLELIHDVTRPHSPGSEATRSDGKRADGNR